MSSRTSRRSVFVGLAGPARQHLDEHRHHDLGPALADQRQRAVEVEQHVADLGARRQGSGQLDAGPLRSVATISDRLLIKRLRYCSEQWFQAFANCSAFVSNPGACKL